MYQAVVVFLCDLVVYSATFYVDLGIVGYEEEE